MREVFEGLEVFAFSVRNRRSFVTEAMLIAGSSFTLHSLVSSFKLTILLSEVVLN